MELGQIHPLWCPLSEMATYDCSQSLCRCCCVPWKCIQLKRLLPWVPTLLMCYLQWCHSTFQTGLGFIHRNHQLWSCHTQSPKSELQPPALAHTDRYMSQAGELPSVQVSLHSVRCKPVVFSSVAPQHHLSQLMSSRARELPRVRVLFFFFRGPSPG